MRRFFLICLLLLTVACQEEDPTPATEDSPANNVADTSEPAEPTENPSDAENMAEPIPLIDTSTGLNANLVSAYNLDGSLQDNTGTGEEMVIYGASPALSQYDVIGAYGFDGIDDYAEIPHHDGFNLENEATLSIWVYYIPQEEESYYTLIKKSDPERDGHARYGLWSIEGKAEVCVEPTNGEVQRCVRSTARLIPEEWNLVTGRYKNGVLDIFVNGDKSGTAEYSPSPIAQNTQPIFLATDRLQSNSLYFEGRLDDIRIYNRALTDDEIQVLFSGL